MSAIRAGDLVVVVGTNCKCDCDFGLILEVESVSIAATICEVCGRGLYKGPHATVSNGNRTAERPLNTLKKIDPLSELEEQKTSDEVPA
jgi:hypothetical protein